MTGVTPEREPYTKNTTKITDINIINHPYENARDRIFSTLPDEDGLKEQVHFDSMKTELTEAEKGVADDILGIMTEIMSVDCETVRIGRADIPLTFVRDRVSKITQVHIRYVIDSFMKNASEVTNVRAYLLTMLYNAPNTMNAYNQSCKNAKNRFNNFEERDYDFDEIEKELLASNYRSS